MNLKTLEMEFLPLILGCDRLVDGYENEAERRRRCEQRGS